MTGQQKIRIVAIGSIVVSLLSILLLFLLTGGDRIEVRAVRFVLTCVLAFFLFRGANWARLLVGVLFLIGVLLSLFAIFSLVTSGGLLSIFTLWLLVMTAFYFWAVYTLLCDPDVAEHCSPTGGF